MNMQVTPHALLQARQRYGLANIDERVIRDDVEAAVRERRVSRTHPNGSGFEAGTDNAFFAWSPGQQRIYVVAFVRPRLTPVFLRVVTALPGSWANDGYRRVKPRRAA